jgi:hypothetical protein
MNRTTYKFREMKKGNERQTIANPANSGLKIEKRHQKRETEIEIEIY